MQCSPSPEIPLPKCFTSLKTSPPPLEAGPLRSPMCTRLTKRGGQELLKEGEKRNYMKTIFFVKGEKRERKSKEKTELQRCLQ